MRELTERIEIRAPGSAVWETLADFGNVSDWAPHMKTSKLIGDVKSGVGTRRGMRHALGFRFEEAVTKWTEGEGYSFHVFRAPFPMTDVRESWLTGRENGCSTVTTTVNYSMKMGALGIILDWLMIRFIVRHEMRTGLHGLKQHLER